ncbi:uncharacterized protein PODANS_6_2515 [Podospora anserina S mat+]|uniref:Podospora anserina S mat+ genomic DNA chromosome 6, supercontig 2 n=1 Tax=Podospora anserina (strain S / ATCC MYA-4624 / DSM 980 / FGSC 10383) TaxID=515849 RepID=B2B2P3_PODAN|nr:uncharacterized protein PODANS_6_2515 [Podospora anserina S mat+]CAP71378.1 unnamed protein product [Podospora anserina S mat+]CDP30778.1 Putative protein of unknown function [Podospora anserina S mat+]
MRLYSAQLSQALVSMTKVAGKGLVDRERFPLQTYQGGRYHSPMDSVSAYHQQRPGSFAPGPPISAHNNLDQFHTSLQSPPSPPIRTQNHLNQSYTSPQSLLHSWTCGQNHAVPQIPVQFHESHHTRNDRIFRQASTTNVSGSTRFIPHNKPADSFNHYDAANCLQSLATAAVLQPAGTKSKRKSLEGLESQSKRQRTVLHQTSPAEEKRSVEEITLAEDETSVEEDKLAEDETSVQEDKPAEEETAQTPDKEEKPVEEPIKDEIVCASRTVISIAGFTR